MSKIKYPFLVDRVKAYSIDWIVLITLMIIVARIISLLDNPSPSLRVYSLIGIFTLYEPILVSFFGGTLGHFLIGLRVTNNEETNKNISLPSSFLRLLVKVLLGWLSFLTVSSSEYKRAIHDIISNSVVIKK